MTDSLKRTQLDSLLDTRESSSAFMELRRQLTLIHRLFQFLITLSCYQLEKNSYRFDLLLRSIFPPLVD